MRENYKFLYILLIIVVFIMLGVSCETAPPPEPEPEPVAEVEPEEPTLTQEEINAREAARRESVAKLLAEEKARKEQVRRETLRKAALEDFLIEDIFFENKRAILDTSAKAILRRKAKWLLDNPDAIVVIEGFSKDWESNEPNMALGELRAGNVKGYLINLGVTLDRLIPVSFGPQKPKNAEWAGTSAKSLRRVHFRIESGYEY